MASNKKLFNEPKSSSDQLKNLDRLLNFSLAIGLFSLFSFFLPYTYIKIPLYSNLIKCFYIFDIIQIFSALLLFILVIHLGFIDYSISIFLKIKGYIQKKRTQKRNPTIIRGRDIILIIFFILIFVIEVNYGNDFAEIAFARKNIQTNIQEPSITAFFKQKVENNLENNSAPSGFVFRQWIILLLALYIFNLNNIKKHIKMIKIGKIQFSPLKIFFYFSFVYVCLARVIRQTHTITDVAAAVCLGTIVFFLIFFVKFIIFKEKIKKNIVDSYVGFSISSFVVFLVISKKPAFWIYVIFVFIVIITLLYTLCKFDKGGKTWR